VITIEALENLSRDRLEDAKVLNQAGRRDWAVYTCGYAAELALKKKICETLRWKGYPNTEKEFSQLKSFKTHDLDLLLHLSGVEDQIKNGEEALTEWLIIASWNPEVRYSLEKQIEERVKLFLKAVEALLKKL
jgi:HEPN domain-containing protein